MLGWRWADKEGHAVMLVDSRACGMEGAEVGRWSRAVKRFEDSRSGGRGRES